MSELDPILEAVGVVLGEVEGRVEQRLEEMRGEMLDRMADYVSSLPPPEPGRDGRDGTDQILVSARRIKPGEICEPNTIAQTNRGLWQSIRVASGGPDEDPSGWNCLVPGLASIEGRLDMTARELVFSCRASDGQCHEVRARMPATALPPDFLEQGWGVLAGDTLRPPGEDIELVALRDGAVLGVAEDWQETRLRGFRGQKGERGVAGPRGPGLTGLTMIKGPRGLLFVPRFEDPKIRAEPIEVDLLVEEPEPGSHPIIGFAGQWNAARTYKRGEVVTVDRAGSSQGGGRIQFLSIKPDNNARPNDPSAWLEM